MEEVRRKIAQFARQEVSAAPLALQLLCHVQKGSTVLWEQSSLSHALRAHLVILSLSQTHRLALLAQEVNTAGRKILQLLRTIVMTVSFALRVLKGQNLTTKSQGTSAQRVAFVPRVLYSHLIVATVSLTSLKVARHNQIASFAGPAISARDSKFSQSALLESTAVRVKMITQGLPNKDTMLLLAPTRSLNVLEVLTMMRSRSLHANHARRVDIAASQR
jgi:hypothetical protein